MRTLSRLLLRCGRNCNTFGLSNLRSVTFATASSTFKNDTIFALSSGAEGVCGVAVIRISGPNARFCLESLTKKTEKFPKPRVATLRHLISPTTGEVLDHAMVLWFPNPRSYTGEDVCELHIHGSRAVIKGLFSALTSLGQSRRASKDHISENIITNAPKNGQIRLAEKGEFTKRAFDNGKLDLTEAEGLGDLLAADTAAQRKQALRQMEGYMRRTYEKWRDELKSCLAHCEAVIDFGDDEREDDVDDSVMWALSPKVEYLCTEIKRYLNDNHRGEIIRGGVRIGLIGPPNAGKSSLLNALAKRPAAIVSPVAGTTRDVVEVRMDIDGVSCILSDTAGIIIDEASRRDSKIANAREDIFHSTDAIEYEGMRRARDVCLSSHVKIVICDSSDASSIDNMTSLLDDLCTPHDDNVIPATNNLTMPQNLKQFINKPLDNEGEKVLENVLIIFNKTDVLFDRAHLTDKIHRLVHEKRIDKSSFNYLSCSTGEGIHDFEVTLSSIIKKMVGDQDTSESLNGEGELITRTRHRSHLIQCVHHLETFLEENLLMDTAAEELRLAMMELGKLTGRVEVEDLLDVIFKEFCIGK